jgi:hypothetical protein
MHARACMHARCGLKRQKKTGTPRHAGCRSFVWRVLDAVSVSLNPAHKRPVSHAVKVCHVERDERRAPVLALANGTYTARV